MAPITPIPTTRVSDILIRQRLQTQLQFDQLSLLRIQSQITTGRRISVPSEDAPAALRGIELQRLLERKQQVRANLTTNVSFLNATDSALASVSGLLADIRGSALTVVDATSTDVQRQAVALEVSRAIQQLVDIANQQFRGRYLFAGSLTTVQPFEANGNLIAYKGNEEHLLSYADIDLLFETNLHGNQVFGAISEPVRGTADLDPILTAETRLSDLRGGRGISDGSIAVSDGTHSSVIDISKAETIGDVAALVRAHPPAGRTLSVTVTATGLTLQLDAAGGGTLSVREVGSGTTASELGILEENGVGTNPLVGSDLDPLLRLTTPLANILGVRASAAVAPAGPRNDLIVEAVDRGPEFNGVTITFVDGGPGTAGLESAVYDPLAGTLEVTIEDGVSTANQVIDAINASGALTAKLDTREAGNDGTGTIQATANDPLATGVTAGGSGVEFDQASGLLIHNGGEQFVISLVSAVTVEDLLNILNGSGAGVLAQINAAGTGIDVRSTLSGTDFSIGENGGSTATELGIRSLTRETRLDQLNHGRGVNTIDGNDFIIQRKDGTRLEFDVSAAQTIGDVLDLINNHPANQDPATQVVAQLATFGNGIELVTVDTATDAAFRVERTTLSLAAIDLGLVPKGEDQSEPAAVGMGVETITGRDVNPLEVKGVFTALVRLREALESSDLREVERAMGLLDDALLDFNFARAELGARQRTLDVMQTRLETEDVLLQQALSDEIDTDLIEAISQFTGRQAALEAALALAARTLQVSLLNFL